MKQAAGYIFHSFLSMTAVSMSSKTWAIFLPCDLTVDEHVRYNTIDKRMMQYRNYR